jgi:hypothetical protein
MSNMRKKHLILVAFLATLLLGITLALTPGTAKAGTNGQQLQVWTGLNSTKIVITGPNQNGQYVTYSFTCIKLGFCGLHRTTGWWWKGWVTIKVYRFNNYNTCSVNVPPYYAGGNYYPTTCLAP